MGEYFELTFFAGKRDRPPRRKELLRFFSLRDGHNAVQAHRFRFFEGKDVLLDTVEERGYRAYCVCVSDVHFTRENGTRAFMPFKRATVFKFSIRRTQGRSRMDPERWKTNEAPIAIRH